MTDEKQERESEECVVEAVAQALFDRLCARCAARGRTPHHPPGTSVRSMPHSYRADYLDDARAAIAAVGLQAFWRFDLDNMPNDDRFEALRVQEVFRHMPSGTDVIEPMHGRMFVPYAWRPRPIVGERE